jgi:spermidine/putrescine transport system ATP-binding protein
LKQPTGRATKSPRWSTSSDEVIDQKVAKPLKSSICRKWKTAISPNLSGGQQQRVAIARAIVNEPQVLLLDEPLSALDHKMRQDMQIELKEMHKKLGITFIYVTHDQEEALSMSDTIVVMKDGAIQQVGTPESIYNEPTNAYVADFIGESNIYNGTMVGKQQKFASSTPFGTCIDDFPLNEKVDVVIRPEDVELGNPGKGTVDGVIASRVFKGEDYSYVINVGKNEVLCRDTHAREVGQSLDPRRQRKPPDHAQGSHRERMGRCVITAMAKS